MRMIAGLICGPAGVLELAALMRRAVTKPCQYCLECTFDKQKHWKRCHVITLCCFIAAFSRRHDSCAFQSSRPPGSSVSDSSRAGEGYVPASCLLHAAILRIPRPRKGLLPPQKPHRRGKEAERQRQGQRQEQRKGQRTGPKQANLLSFFRKQP